MFIGTEFSKLSIKRYKPVGGVWLGTQIDNLNFKLPFYPRKNFQNSFFFKSEFFSENSAPSVYFNALIKLLV
jgi:hypothetical protein